MAINSFQVPETAVNGYPIGSSFQNGLFCNGLLASPSLQPEPVLEDYSFPVDPLSPSNNHFLLLKSKIIETDRVIHHYRAKCCKVKELQTSLRGFKRDLKQLQQENNKLQSTIVDLKEELERKRNAEEGQKAYIEQLKAQCETLEVRGSEAARSLIETLRKEKKELIAERDRLRKENRKLEKRVKMYLQGPVVSAESKSETLKARKEKQVLIASLKEELNKLGNAIAEDDSDVSFSDDFDEEISGTNREHPSPTTETVSLETLTSNINCSGNGCGSSMANDSAIAEDDSDVSFSNEFDEEISGTNREHPPPTTETVSLETLTSNINCSGNGCGSSVANDSALVREQRKRALSVETDEPAKRICLDEEQEGVYDDELFRDYGGNHFSDNESISNGSHLRSNSGDIYGDNESIHDNGSIQNSRASISDDNKSTCDSIYGNGDGISDYDSIHDGNIDNEGDIDGVHDNCGAHNDDGSHDNGSGDNGSGNDGSGNDGSGNDGSGDDGSGDDGSDDDGSDDDGSDDDGSDDDGSDDDGSDDDGSHDDGSHDNGSHDDGSNDNGSHYDGNIYGNIHDNNEGFHDNGIYDENEKFDQRLLDMANLVHMDLNALSPIPPTPPPSPIPSFDLISLPPLSPLPSSPPRIKRNNGIIDQTTFITGNSLTTVDNSINSVPSPERTAPILSPSPLTPTSCDEPISSPSPLTPTSCNEPLSDNVVTQSSDRSLEVDNSVNSVPSSERTAPVLSSSSPLMPTSCDKSLPDNVVSRDTQSSDRSYDIEEPCQALDDDITGNQTVMSCDQSVVSCDQSAVSCDQSVVSCDQLSTRVVIDIASSPSNILIIDNSDKTVLPFMGYDDSVAALPTINPSTENAVEYLNVSSVDSQATSTNFPANENIVGYSTAPSVDNHATPTNVPPSENIVGYLNIPSQAVVTVLEEGEISDDESMEVGHDIATPTTNPSSNKEDDAVLLPLRDLSADGATGQWLPDIATPKGLCDSSSSSRSSTPVLAYEFPTIDAQSTSKPAEENRDVQSTSKPAEENTPTPKFCQAQQSLKKQLQCPKSLPPWLAEALVQSQEEVLITNGKNKIQIPQMRKPKGMGPTKYVFNCFNSVLSGKLSVTKCVVMLSNKSNILSTDYLCNGLIKYIQTKYFPPFDTVMKLCWNRCSAIVAKTLDPFHPNYIPPLPLKEAIILSMILNIQQLLPEFPALIPDLLDKLKECILSESCNFHTKCVFSRLHNCLCRSLLAINQAQFLVCDILLLSMAASTLPLVVTAISVWPKVFSRNTSGPSLFVREGGPINTKGLEYQPLSFTLEFILSYLAQTQSEQKLHKGPVSNARILCKWDVIPVEILPSLVTSFTDILKLSPYVKMETPPSDNSSAHFIPRPNQHTFVIVTALRLLANSQGWTWTNDTLIRQHLWPVIHKWNKEPTSTRVETVICIIRLLGFVGRMGFQSDPNSASVTQLTKAFGAILKKSPSDKSEQLLLPIQLVAADALLDFHRYSRPPFSSSSSSITQTINATLMTWTTQLMKDSTTARYAIEYRKIMGLAYKHN